MGAAKIKIQNWNNLAQIYQDKFMTLELYNHTYDTFCELVRKTKPSIFEIACGPGNITKYLLTKRPDFNIDAIDAAPEMIKLAIENNPGANFEVMDCRIMDRLTNTFDGIICGFCLPYLSKPECNKLIKDSFQHLNSGGILYFSAIEGNYSESGYEISSDGQHKMFVYYYEENYLLEILEKNNFELLEINRISYKKTEKITDTHLVFLAIKKQK